MFHKKSAIIFFIFCLLNISFQAGATMIPTQKLNQTLHNQLPDTILKNKQLVVVNIGHVPPYVIYDSANEMSGAGIDIVKAIGQILGVTIQNKTTNNNAAVLMGIQSGRYDLGIGPLADLPERQLKNDFIAYAASYNAFAVRSGNPKNIHTLADTCGKQMASAIGGHSFEYLTDFSKTCVGEGKAPIEVLGFKDQASAMLAVQSGRADAMMGGIAILSYYVSLAKDELELAGTKDIGELPERYYSAVVNKNSPLGPIILAALQELFDNGTYVEIMKKWNLETSMLAKPGINLAK